MKNFRSILEGCLCMLFLFTGCTKSEQPQNPVNTGENNTSAMSESEIPEEKIHYLDKINNGRERYA